MNLQVKPKTKNIFYILFDEKYRGILPRKILLRFFTYSAKNTKNIDAEIANKIDSEIKNFALKKLLSFLTYRERSIQESNYYLHNLRFSDDIIRETINKAISYNYINDDRFARMYVESLIEKNKSKKEIKHKLIEKGIETTIIEKVISELYIDDKNHQIIEKIIEKYLYKYRTLTRIKQKEKILNYLIRKGFSYDEIIIDIEKLLPL